MARSLAAGEVVPVEPGPTIADGLKPTRVGELNFAIAKQHVAGAMTVDDAEIGAALAILALEAKVVVEPSGAATMAAALRGDLPGNPERVGLILSGGNIAPAQLTHLIDQYAS
jgi:threonine dehydratase